MKGQHIGLLAMMLVAGVSSPSRAEYLIYLKGGHYITADDCTFSSRQVRVEEGDTTKEDTTIVQMEDCAKGRPEGQIFWSTIDGTFGEVNADDVYYIFGSKGLASVAPHRQAKPLEDYLIVNRGESFINAKVVSESEGRVYGVKRDDLADVNKRGIKEIVPAADAKSRSGEGLCPGEQAEFDVTDTDYVSGHFIGLFKNLSRESCMEATFEVEVKVNEIFRGKFEVKEASAVVPGMSKHVSREVTRDVGEYIKRSKMKEGGVQLCWRKVRSLAQCEAEGRQKSK